MDSFDSWLEAHNFPPSLLIMGLEIPSVVIFTSLMILPFIFGRSIAPTLAPSSIVEKVICVDRRSVMKYSSKAPEASIKKALNAAIHAPNHWLSEPWRFYRLGPKSRSTLSDLKPEKKQLFDGVPDMILVTMVPSMAMNEHSMSEKRKSWDGSWNKFALEDHAATAAAVQNMMLSLASDGVGSKWMTGAMGIGPEELLKLVGADNKTEHFMGVIFIGIPAEKTSEMKVPSRKNGLYGGILKICD